MLWWAGGGSSEIICKWEIYSYGESTARRFEVLCFFQGMFYCPYEN